jgi:PQQ-like domain
MSMPNRVRAAVVVGAALTLAACTSSSNSAATPSAAGSSNSAAGSSTVASSPASSSPASSTPASSAAPARTAASTAPASSTGTATPDPTTGAAAASKPTSIWPTYHHDNARSGVSTTASIVKGLKVTGAATLDAAIYASPIVVSDTKGDLVIAATENNTVYGLRDTGAVVWKQHLGTPVDGSTLPCGNINPTGITGTPVYDPTTGNVYVVTFRSGDQHLLVALDAETGSVRFTRNVDPAGSHPNVEQERGALLLADGRVWVPYGGLNGDCGPYHGYLVGVPTSGQGASAIYQVPSTREAGIWTPAGAASDAAGHVYVSVGNGAQENAKAAYDLSDSVIELNVAPNPPKVVSFFAPANWASENAGDLDLGTTGPVILPTGQVFVAGKDGSAYLMKQGALGGLGAKVPSIKLCTAFGGAALFTGTLYLPCTDGVRAVKISRNTMTATWHAAPSGSPIVGGGVVLTVDAKAGTLYALNPATGAVRFTVGLGGSTTRFATPSMSSGHVYVGTQSGRLDIIATQ